MARSPKYCAFPVDARFKYPIDFSLPIPPAISPPPNMPRTPLDTPPAPYAPVNKATPSKSIELPFDDIVTNDITSVLEAGVRRYPPINTPRVGDAIGAGLKAFLSASPKSKALPVVEICI